MRWHRTNFRATGSQSKIFWFNFYQQSDVRIKPGTAGWEAWTLPLCYAVPPIISYCWFYFVVKSNRLFSTLLIPEDFLESFLQSDFEQIFYKDLLFGEMCISLRSSNLIFVQRFSFSVSPQVTKNLLSPSFAKKGSGITKNLFQFLFRTVWQPCQFAKQLKTPKRIFHWLKK